MMYKGYRRQARPRRKQIDFLFGSAYTIDDVTPVNIPGIYQKFNKYFRLVFRVELIELYFQYTLVVSPTSEYYADYTTSNFKKDSNGDILIYLKSASTFGSVWLKISSGDDVLIYVGYA